MKITQDELYKIKEEYHGDFKNKVYCISSKAHYHGEAFVYAESSEDANKQIHDFKNSDPNNCADSWGYCSVEESDFTGDFTDEQRQVTGGIWYYG